MLIKWHNLITELFSNFTELRMILSDKVEASNILTSIIIDLHHMFWQISWQKHESENSFKYLIDLKAISQKYEPTYLQYFWQFLQLLYVLVE